MGRVVRDLDNCQFEITRDVKHMMVLDVDVNVVHVERGYH